MKRLLVFALLFVLAACGGGETQIAPTSVTVTQTESAATLQATSDAPAGETKTAAPSAGDFFSQMGIELPAPVCDGTPTLSQTEGPYYTPDTPERDSLLDPGMPGQRLVLVGYVLDRDCRPIPDAWLDFWQADADGNYDNQGYTLRGHQFTDGQGRFHLETVVPGQYPGRTEHIHVKVQPPGGSVLTSQLYFPDQASANQQDGIFDLSLLVQLEDRGGFLLATFDFIVNGN